MKSGQMLTHYRVEEKIGAGGMGEVYRAHDTVLGRDVALKILPPAFADDSDRMTRFQREAKVLASLHHPNIASIFGFETTEECTFLVMELVEGEDLSEVLLRGALPVDEAVDIARQIAEGLEEAHEKGIIHRDLKPANVKRTPDGKVKVLDFGLARAYAGETAGEGEVASAPTMTAAMTQIGTVLGTAAYMSPEQARGKEVDRRTDIWAFGVLLFEMLTGRQLFVGETASDTMAGILKSEPEWDLLPQGLPFQVERVIRRCLAKEPRQRLRDIGEARVRLENPEAESGMFSGPVAVAPAPKSLRKKLTIWGLVSIKAAVVVWLIFGRADKVVELPAWHVAIPAPTDANFHVTGSFPGLPVISPDGTHVVFSGRVTEGHRVQLYLRSLAASEAVALPNTEDAQYPFWSPDGKWVGFYARDKGLMKIMISGGPPQMVCEASNGKGASWNESGQILFTTDYNSSVMMVDATGGISRDVTDLAHDTGFNSHRHPQFLPDGRRFLYFARSEGNHESEVRLASLDDSTHQVVMLQTMMVQYASGHILYINQETLFAQPFDLKTGLMSGTPTRVASDLLTVPGAAKGAFSASDNGILTYLRGFSTLDASLVWLDRDGREQGTVGDLALYDMVTLSSDGRRAATGVIDQSAGTWDLWVVDIERNFRSRFTETTSDEYGVVWLPDNRTLLFASDRKGKGGVYRKQIGSAEPAEHVFPLDTSIFLWDASNDGNTIIYSTLNGETKMDLWSVELSGDPQPRLLRQMPEDDVMARLSPDEKWLTFASVTASAPQVFVAPWPQMTPLTQVSTTNGTWSYWTKDGRELIYMEIDGTVVAVAMTPEAGEMRIGAPEILFDTRAPVIEGPYLSVSEDGERFLTVNAVDSDPPQFCDVIMNWPAMVKVQ